MAVTVSEGYRISSLPSREAPRYTIPVQVAGPLSFLLLAVWSKTDLNFRYVKGIIRAVDCYREMIAAQHTIIVGDFNSNRIWDYKRPSDQNHSGLVRNLEALGLVSAYHRFHGEEQGAETRPTLHLLKKRTRPYHIDYCFIPGPGFPICGPLRSAPMTRGSNPATILPWWLISHCPERSNKALQRTGCAGR